MVLKPDYVGYRKLAKSGSILKGLRSFKGGGLGLIAGGWVFIGFAVFTGLLFLPLGTGGALFFLGLFGIPGIILIGIGIPMRNRRNRSYMEFYQKETGFSEQELLQLDQELAAPDVEIIGYIRSGGGSKKHPGIACIITEHYFVTEWYYIRRLEDMIAAAYTDETSIFGLLCLAKQDTDTRFMTFGTPADKKKALCTEIIQALLRRNPNLICHKRFLWNGQSFDLEKDGKVFHQMYMEAYRSLL